MRYVECSWMRRLRYGRPFCGCNSACAHGGGIKGKDACYEKRNTVFWTCAGLCRRGKPCSRNRVGRRPLQRTRKRERSGESAVQHQEHAQYTAKHWENRDIFRHKKSPQFTGNISPIAITGDTTAHAKCFRQFRIWPFQPGFQFKQQKRRCAALIGKCFGPRAEEQEFA